MKTFLIAFVVTTVVFQVQAGLDKQESIDLMKKCQSKVGSSEDVEKLFETQDIPESHEGKCMLACVAEEKGMIKDDKIDIQSATDFFEKTFKDDPDQLEKGAAVIGKCATIDVKGLDKCEMAAAYAKCGKDINSSTCIDGVYFRLKYTWEHPHGLL